MGNKEKIILSWSAGKDSALALHELMRSGIYEIVALITTVTEEYERNFSALEKEYSRACRYDSFFGF